MNDPTVIRPARTDDFDGIADVLRGSDARHEPDDAGDCHRLWRATHLTHPWLVAQRSGLVVGVALAAPWHTPPAYAWTAELRAHVAPPWRGRRIGSALYANLLDRLDRQGFVSCFASVALPNAAAVALNEAHGFRRVGVLEGAARFGDEWADVALYQRRTTQHARSAPPRLAWPD